jgi:hypothetical protein
MAKKGFGRPAWSGSAAEIKAVERTPKRTPDDKRLVRFMVVSSRVVGRGHWGKEDDGNEVRRISGWSHGV